MGRRCLVIGGGIGGLSAAFELERAGVDVLIIDKRATPGGVMQTHASGGYLFEDGPNSIAGSAQPFNELTQDLGLSARIVPSRPEAKVRFLYDHGTLQQIPMGGKAFFTTRLLSWGDRLRLFREPWVAPRRDGEEETVAGFCSRRLGNGIVNILDAVISGIFAGDPRRLSMEGAFPEVVALEREYGSLFGAMRMRGKQRRLAAGPNPPPKAPPMVSFERGLGELTTALAGRLGSRIRLGATATAMRPQDGGGFRVTFNGSGGSETVDADGVILAVPASSAGKLLGPLVPAAVPLFDGIEHASMTVIQAGFDARALPGFPGGFGFLVPRREKRRNLGWIVASQIFGDRAPAGKHALVGFFGGVHDPGVLALQDDDIRRLALEDLRTALKLPAPPEPEHFRVVRWPAVIPQYNVGHLRRMDELVGLVKQALPRVRLGGSYVGGVSVPKCITRGRTLAREMAATMGGGA